MVINEAGIQALRDLVHDWRAEAESGISIDAMRAKNHSANLLAMVITDTKYLSDDAPFDQNTAPADTDMAQALRALLDAVDDTQWEDATGLALAALEAHESRAQPASTPDPEWLANLRRELRMSKITHNFTLTRDELAYILGDSLLAPPPAQPASVAVTDEMVQRFLSWRLPEPWHPDNGISYQRPNYAHAPAPHDWPTGTNLFDVHQARAMLEHVFAAASQPPMIGHVGKSHKGG